MKKVIFTTFLIGILLSLSIISAMDLSVKTTFVQNAYIIETKEPAVFDLSIRNDGPNQEILKIYSLVGLSFFPDTKYQVSPGETRKIQVQVMPSESLLYKKGYSTFEYEIKNEKNAIQRETITLNILGLTDAISIEAESITPKSDQINFNIKNNVAIDFEDLEIKMSSAFFIYDSKLQLKSGEKTRISIPLDKEKIKRLDSGKYFIDVLMKTKDTIANEKLEVNFLEQDNILSSDISKGFLIRTQKISRENRGNTVKSVEISASRNIFSYLFTTINVPATESEIAGFRKYYAWKKELSPGDNFSVTIRTNWLYPFLIILVIILAIYLIKKSFEADVSLRKRVSFVKTKGGQFALRINIGIKAKKHIENINIIERLPGLVNLYEKFGAIQPNKVDLKNKKLEWNIPILNSGEERIFTYIVYSKVGVVGKFELPLTTATYKRDGKIRHAHSNKAVYINEPKKQI